MEERQGKEQRYHKRERTGGRGRRSVHGRPGGKDTGRYKGRDTETKEQICKQEQRTDHNNTKISEGEEACM